MFNIGDNTAFANPWPWMRMGMSCMKDYDGAYFGLKTEDSDRSDAVIAFGNDAAGPVGPDVLRFIFTRNQSEIARFAPNGGNGFGNFYQYGINTQPVRRLEILDADPTGFGNSNAPQLRLTYNYDSNPLQGTFTEFQTTSVGDMYFNTRFNGDDLRNFGFHQVTPQNCVEINSHLGNTGYGTVNGSSGLRLTNMTSANTPVANPGTGVLSVNTNGDVILVNGGGTSNANSGLTVNGGNVQLGINCNAPIVQKIANGLVTDRMIYLNGKNLTFADGGRVGIGTGINNCTVGNKLEITSGLSMPYWPVQATNGSSGLRFTFLNSTKTPIANGTNGVDNTKVLSVDQNGDVVLVKSSGSGALTGANNGISTNAGIAQLGVPCTDNLGFINLGAIVANQLTQDRVIANRNQNFWIASLNTETGGVGIGGQLNSNAFCNTGNTFEISANSKNPQYGSNDASGLRFTKLISSSPVVANGVNGVDATKVLTVDGDGDVVLTNASGTAVSNNGIGINSGFIQLGGNCANATEVANAKLLTDRKIAMNGKNIIWSEGNTGFGLGSCTPGNRVEILGLSSNQSGLRFTNLTSASTPQANVGNAGYLALNANGDVIYTHGYGFGAPCGSSTPYNLSSDWLVNMNGKNMNFVGDGSFYIGDYAYNSCHPSPTLARLFVRNTYGPSPTIPLIAFHAANWANYTIGGYAASFSGDIDVNGIPFVLNPVQVYSDERIKTNVQKISSAMNIIKQINPVSYNYNNSYAQQLKVDSNSNYGFIAQHIETILPNLVKTSIIPAEQDSTGIITHPSKEIKSLNYDGLIPFAIKGIQELDSLHQQLSGRVDSLVAHPATGGNGGLIPQNGLNNLTSGKVELGGSLLHPTSIDLNNNSFNFYSTSGSSAFNLANNGRIIHYAKSLSPVFDAAYDMYSDGFGAGLRLNLTNTPTGLDNNLTGNAGQLTGVYSHLLSTNNAAGSRAYGVLSHIEGVAETNVAVRGLIQQTGNTNIGLESEVRNGKTNIGVNVYVDRNIVDPNGDIKDLYGIRSVVAPNNGGSNMNVGVYSAVGSGVTNPNSPGTAPYFYAGYFAGSMYVSGQIGGPSDSKLKQNITALTNATDIIKQLQPKTFDYKQSSYPNMNLPQGLQYGLIAQEVENILPDVVTNNISPEVKDSTGAVVTPAETFKGLEYQQLIPILIQALKEQTAKVDSLQTKLNKKDSLQDARMSAIEAALNACCQNPNNARVGTSAGFGSAQPTPLSTQDVELSDKDVIVLTQNVPNPFAEQTTIAYNVPSKVQKAQIIFYNAMGQIIETVDIKTRGKGKLNVFASDLSSGLYHYTLVADGKVVDSKKMVRE